jgi:hypothetical protein
VAWCPSDFCQLASCGDDSTLRLWSLPLQTDRSKWPRRRLCPEPTRQLVEAPDARLTQNSLLAHVQPATAEPFGEPASPLPETLADRSCPCTDHPTREPLTPVNGNAVTEGALKHAGSPISLVPSAAVRRSLDGPLRENMPTSDAELLRKLGEEHSASHSRDCHSKQTPPLGSPRTCRTPMEIDGGCAESGTSLSPVTGIQRGQHQTLPRMVQATIPGYLFTPSPSLEDQRPAAQESSERPTTVNVLQRGQLSIADFLNRRRAAGA